MSYLTTYQTVIKREAEALGMSHMLVDIYEANLDADSVKDFNFPLCIHMLPSKERNSQISPMTVERTVSLTIFILFRVAQSTVDKAKVDLAPTVQNARYLADRLVKKLSKSEITQGEGVQNWSTNETYAEFDSNLHGIILEFDWKIIDTLPCY
jgi:hypothetical protein